MSLFARDKYSKVKNQAIPLLINIVQITATSKMAEELKIQAVIEKFFMELTRPTKHSATGSWCILSCINSISESKNCDSSGGIVELVCISGADKQKDCAFND